jgi:hypothetical protein
MTNNPPLNADALLPCAFCGRPAMKTPLWRVTCSANAENDEFCPGTTLKLWDNQWNTRAALPAAGEVDDVGVLATICKGIEFFDANCCPESGIDDITDYAPAILKELKAAGYLHPSPASAEVVAKLRKPINNDRFDYRYEHGYNQGIDDAIAALKDSQ